MFHKRLMQEFRDNMKYVAGMVATQWLMLIANVFFMYTLAGFIRQYVEGVRNAMERILEVVRSGGEVENECCPNFYYFHFLFQVRMYYPGVREKMEGIFRQEYEMWKKVIRHAIDIGEIRKDTDVEKTAALFRQTFMGMSYEESFFDGLNVNTLEANFEYLYSMLKA